MTSTKLPTTSFTHSLRQEAERLIYILNRATSLEFQSRGFYILPTLPTIGQDRCVIIPRLDYNKVKGLWRRVASLKPTTPMTGPDDLVHHLAAMLQPSYDNKAFLAHENITREEWSKVYPAFFKSLFNILPQYQNVLDHINIISTSCGTTAQFSSIRDGKREMTIYLRTDQGVTAIAEAVVSAIIRPNLQYNLHYTWEEIESISDFLLRDTSLSQSLPSLHLGTIASLRKEQLGALQQQSSIYLAELGLDQLTLWHKTDGIWCYGDKKIDNISGREQLLLEVLLAQRGKTVSYDQLAACIYPDQPDYSLWAVVKEVSRLRLALTSHNLPPALLQAHRKLGYSII